MGIWGDLFGSKIRRRRAASLLHGKTEERCGVVT